MSEVVVIFSAVIGSLFLALFCTEKIISVIINSIHRKG